MDQEINLGTWILKTKIISHFRTPLEIKVTTKVANDKEKCKQQQNSVKPTAIIVEMLYFITIF